jgi:hypothetical protein
MRLGNVTGFSYALFFRHRYDYRQMQVDAGTVQVKIGDDVIDTSRDKPGAFIGNNAIFYPQVNLTNDVAANTIVRSHSAKC